MKRLLPFNMQCMLLTHDHNVSRFGTAKCQATPSPPSKVHPRFIRWMTSSASFGIAINQLHQQFATKYCIEYRLLINKPLIWRELSNWRGLLIKSLHYTWRLEVARLVNLTSPPTPPSTQMNSTEIEPLVILSSPPGFLWYSPKPWGVKHGPWGRKGLRTG